MASPTIESICCLKSGIGLEVELIESFHNFSYNLVSIFSSLLGIAGALYQILGRRENEMLQNSVSLSGHLRTRGKLIIRWLAVSDLMAAIGIFVRSTLWISRQPSDTSPDGELLNRVVCAAISAWIHYFYTVTYAWTFLYALDVNCVLRGKKAGFASYHAGAWLVSAAFSLVGLLFLYLPDFNCSVMMGNRYLRFLPDYLAIFLPILFVMVVNPLLYVFSFNSVEKLLIMATGRYTETERNIVQSLRLKFLMINVVFFVCWTPNIINGLLLFASWNSLPPGLLEVVWYLMAILNPLQAVFNCFVYRSWAAGSASSQPIWTHPNTAVFDYTVYENSSSDDEELINTYEGYDKSGPTGSVSHRTSAVLRSMSLQKPSEKTPLIGLSGDLPLKSPSSIKK